MPDQISVDPSSNIISGEETGWTVTFAFSLEVLLRIHTRSACHLFFTNLIVCISGWYRDRQLYFHYLKKKSLTRYFHHYASNSHEVTYPCATSSSTSSSLTRYFHHSTSTCYILLMHSYDLDTWSLCKSADPMTKQIKWQINQDACERKGFWVKNALQPPAHRSAYPISRTLALINHPLNRCWEKLRQLNPHRWS